MHNMLMANMLAATLSVQSGDTRNELANRVPPNKRSAAKAKKPTNPAAQNLTVTAITTMLRVMSNQPITV